MDAILKKLNFKDQKALYVMNQPDSFLPNLEAMKQITLVKTSVEPGDEIEFAVVFAITQKQLDESVNKIGPNLIGDAIFWVAYPKGSSKKYKCEFNRDNGWYETGKFGLEVVRQVAIDEDWSALRFRKVAFIKKMTRSDKMIWSAEGKALKDSEL
jgi:hypothetical protein